MQVSCNNPYKANKVLPTTMAMGPEFDHDRFSFLFLLLNPLLTTSATPLSAEAKPANDKQPTTLHNVVPESDLE